MQPVLAFLQRIWNVLKEYWQKTERKDRVRFIAISAVALIGVVIAVVMLTRVDYVALYSEMDAAQMGEVSDLLTSEGVRHKLEGSTIMVPAAERDRLIASLAVQGYPKSGYTYDYYTRATGFAVSESERKNWYRVQIEENLRSSIMTNPNIKDARVTIAQPDNAGIIYRSEIVPVTASVTVTLLDKLTAQQINGLVTMVSTSYPNLSPENVTVVDQHMNLLSSIAPVGIDLLASHEDLRLTVQNELERGIMTLLVPMYGAKHVRVVCYVGLNFDESSSERVTVTPVNDTDGIVESMHESIEQATGGMTGDQTGIDANGGDEIPLYDETTQQGDTWSSTVRTINYNFNQLVERITEAQGKIEHLSAAIVIDSNKYTNRSIPTDVQGIVRGVLGLSQSDAAASVVVQTQPFEGIVEDDLAYNEYLAELRRQQLYELIRFLVPCFMIGVCVLVLIWRLFKLFHKGPSAEELLEMQRAAEMEQLDEYADLVKLAATAEDIETSKTPERMKVEDFVERSPDMVANLLRNWLSEENSGRRR